MDKWCVGVWVGVGVSPPMLEKHKPYLSGGCLGPGMLSAAPHSCPTEANINRATEPPPGRAALECPRLLPTLLGSYPWSQEPGIRLQLAGLPAAPAGLLWACSAAWAVGPQSSARSCPPATLPASSLHSPRPPSLPQDHFHEATGNRSVRARNRTF